MTTRRRLTAALATACIVLGAGSAATSSAVAAGPAGAAKCSFRGHAVSARDNVPCSGAKSVLRGWLDFGGFEGAVSGPGGLLGVWRCYRAKPTRLGRCKRSLDGSVSARFRFT